MILEHPERLWALLIVPVLWWLARPPRPRRALATAHLGVWDAALRRIGRRDARFRRWRFWLLVLAVAAAALASTAPRLADRPGPSRYVVIVDRTASSAAIEADGSTASRRIGAGLAGWLATLPAGTDLRLVDLRALDPAAIDRDSPGYVTGAPQRGRGAVRVRRGNPAEIAALLDAPPLPVGAGVDLEAIAAELAGDAGTFVVLWTDGRGGPTAAPEGWRREAVATDRPNAGFVAAAVDDRWPLPEVIVDVAVVGAASERFDVRGGARLTAVAVLDDGAAVGGPRRYRLRLARGGGGPVEIRGLDWPAADALAVDDVLRLDLPPPPAPDIAVLAAERPDPALRHAAERLAALAGGAVVPAAAGRPVAFLLVDGGRLPAVPGPCLTVGTAFGAVAATAGAQVPRVADWNREHPVTRGLDLSELVVRAALPAAALPVGEVLIRGVDGPLAVAAEVDGRRSVHLAFGLGEANLAGLPAWPQLLLRSWIWTAVGAASARVAPAQPLDPVESDLVVRRGTAGPPVPEPARRGARLVFPLLAVALVALAVRVWT